MKHVSFLMAEWRWQTCQRVIVRIKWDHSLEEWSQKDVSLPCYLLGTWYINQYFSAKDYLHFQIGIIQYFTGFLWELRLMNIKYLFGIQFTEDHKRISIWKTFWGRRKKTQCFPTILPCDLREPSEMGGMNWGEHYNKIQVLFSDWLMHQSIATYSTIAMEKLTMSYTPSDSLGSLTLS